jgi:cytochrome c peroxidase
MFIAQRRPLTLALTQAGTLQLPTLAVAATEAPPPEIGPLSPANPGWVERRNSPTLINVGYNQTLFWDGRVFPLEKQAIGSTKYPSTKVRTSTS